MSEEKRITPAYTGNTLTVTLKCCGEQDHPRIHGEHVSYFARIVAVVGSPPHTRGTRVHCVRGKHELRITPAYTGNTYGSDNLDRVEKDHPRIHGEHLTVF